MIQLFGFANICANWDYSPSRELTAMVYPLFEYSLLVYLCLDFLQTQLSYKRGELNEWFYTFAKIVFPINIFLCAQFRKYSALLTAFINFMRRDQSQTKIFHV